MEKVNRRPRVYEMLRESVVVLDRQFNQWLKINHAAKGNSQRTVLSCCES